MTRAVLLAALIAPAALAQLRLYVAPPNSEAPVSVVFDLGSVASGDVLDTRFRVRNHGAAAVTVTTLGVAGSGFSLAGQPSIPYIIAAGMNLDFTVRFQARDHGGYSANLAVNGINLVLRATATASTILRANGNPLISGSSVDFGRVERGAAAALVFEIANATTQTLAVRSVQLTGAAFRSDDLPAPSELGSGAALSFTLKFEPRAAGVFTGALSVDGREIRLTGAAMEPPFTRPALVLDGFAAECAKQGRISVQFGAPSRASGSGRLRISFQPAAGVDNDGGLLFASTGTRSIPFTVAEGDSEAKFGAAGQAVFQTGATAGTIVFTAEVGGYAEQTSVVIPAAAVKFDQATAARNGSSLEVQLTGYDNTQSVGDLAFTFYDRSGKPVQPGSIKVNARDDFKRYFEGSRIGGMFSLRATFPVAGNIADIDAVEVEFTNSAATARTSRLRF